MSNLISVAHVDHSTERGGAEYALLRMLELPPPWRATLLLPRNPSGSLGVYEALSATPQSRALLVGPAQTFGASKARLAFTQMVSFGIRCLGQAWSIRRSKTFAEVDLVHANTSRAAVYLAIACLFSKKPLVVHLRDIVDKRVLGGIGYLLFTRVALARTNGVIANSSATLRSAKPYLSESVLTAVIASASGISDVHATPDSGGPIRRIGMVARLDPWKGQDLLIRAFARSTSNSGPKPRLILAGSAPFGNHAYEEHLRQLATDLGVADRVDFLGHVENVHELIESLDVCVQASLRPEPLGQNVLQYLAGGRATVAVNAGGPKEWIEPGVNGMLFEMGDEFGLAKALEQLSANPHRRSELARAAALSSGLSSDAEIAAQHDAFFRSVRERSQGVDTRGEVVA